jgi:pantetheine-phosphate adenylyltransferase
MADIENQVISSSLVKEIARLGGNMNKFTTKSTIRALKEKLR